MQQIPFLMNLGLFEKLATNSKTSLKETTRCKKIWDGKYA
jgi:SAM-dependent MidA family methyltransferase